MTESGAWFVLFLMLFLHICDDYYFQGILASMKQKSWWTKQENYSDVYQHDYIVALVEHAFSWTFMIMLPIMILYHFSFTPFIMFFFLCNWIIHGITDHCKANLKAINLIQDQTIHVCQIFLTWAMLVVMM